MSGKQLIADIKEKDQVRSKFMVTKKDSSVSKAGKAYLSLRLADVSGELEARVWDNAVELGALFEKGDVVEVKGFGNSYMGKVQLNINSIKKISLEGFDPTEFLPSSKFPLEGMMSELESIIDEMKNKHLKELLNTIFADKKTRLSFMRSPAAKVMHHPYIGGLLEHVLSLAKLSRLVCSHYDEVEEDLVLTGLILHDIGKIYELSPEAGFDYTSEGKLIGHITMGVEIISKAISKHKDFPQDLAIKLKHVMLSHHGQLEYGSPKRPKTMEALVVSYLDDLDAKVNMFSRAITSEDGDENWSPFNRSLERYIYKGGGLEDRPTEPSAKDDKKEGDKKADQNELF